MKLGIVYHIPFWRASDGALVEAEGSFARYVDSLAPYFDEISICAPEQADPGIVGTRVSARNVTLAPLPFFEGPRQFYPQLPSIVARLAGWVRRIDVLHCRVPTPAAFPAFLLARLRRVPCFLLIVGDLRALLPTRPYRGLKRVLFSGYTAWEEFGIAAMARRALNFANGAALAEKHREGGLVEVFETRTTTIGERDIADRFDACSRAPIKMLSVSRIDPRKGLRVVPDVLARLSAHSIDASIDIVGPTVGRTGSDERAAIERRSAELGVADRVRFSGPMPLDTLLPRYRDYDLFVLPTLPGEGIPRVLLEAMAGGLPLVTTRVAGIPSLIRDGDNGLLVDAPSADAVAAAVEQIVASSELRHRLIAGGYATARMHTLDRQAASMMARLQTTLAAPLRAASVA